MKARKAAEKAIKIAKKAEEAKKMTPQRRATKRNATSCVSESAKEQKSLASSSTALSSGVCNRWTGGLGWTGALEWRLSS